MSRCIGLTGGIASGKSLAAEILAEQGARILDADQFARELVQPGHANLRQIAAQLGPEYLEADRSLNRARLRARIFHDRAAKQWLEALLHPQIRQHFVAETAAIAEESPEAIILWILPLLVESHYAPLLDGVLLLDCPAWLQMQRLLARGWDPETAKEVIAQQIHPEERRRIAEWIIPNLRPPSALRQRLEHWWQALDP